ncbi:uncharacterized protein MELLADRAFT_110709 [Melampsora larici-populina 98AG31]|uniref:Uncharacterized protein n=1 Tax=Melampsora larici-populina (strain 98AG31 / pathotype 3-4-7) TaxID=747676 RepID=F4S0P6_MELLP|nr:uncharacterized protein MELLADRAFT_110709 [Melampsora larici-populina 98AG31]EGG01799.1 hypothetical protein MELLADRAFT_110709 [Melampsora larici-populina 98AG31]
MPSMRGDVVKCRKMIEGHRNNLLGTFLEDKYSRQIIERIGYRLGKAHKIVAVKSDIIRATLSWGWQEHTIATLDAILSSHWVPTEKDKIKLLFTGIATRISDSARCFCVE